MPVPEVEALQKKGLSRGTRQRIAHRRAFQSARAESVIAFNSLMRSAENTPDETLMDRATAIQQDVLDHIAVCQTSFAPCAEVTSEEALRALLRTDSVYDQGSVTKVACFREGKVSLPDQAAIACYLRDHLSGEPLECLENFETLCLLNSEKHEGRK